MAGRIEAPPIAERGAPMRRGILIALLSLGTIGGFASGFCSLHRAHAAHREAFERHVAKLCVDAAKSPTPPPH